MAGFSAEGRDEHHGVVIARGPCRTFLRVLERGKIRLMGALRNASGKIAGEIVERVMNLLTRTTAAALIAGGVVSLASSASAVPLGASLALRDASTPPVQTVRWRGWGGVGIGLAAGAFVGAIAASRYSYGYGYGYAPAYYYGGYAPAYYGYSSTSPAYGYNYAPGYGTRLQRLQRLRLCARLRIPLCISLRLCLPALPGARLHRALSGLAPLVIAAPAKL